MTRAATPAPDTVLLDVRTVAARLCFSRRWVEARLHSGELPYLRIGGRIRIRESDLADFIEHIRTN